MLELSFGFSSLGLFLDSTDVSFIDTSSTISSFFLDPPKLSRSIFPKWIGFFISFLSMKETCFLTFSSSSFSFFNLNSSFSFLFSSLKSWDSTLFDLSDRNYCISDGSIIAEGTKKDLLKNAEAIKRYFGTGFGF